MRKHLVSFLPSASRPFMLAVAIAILGCPGALDAAPGSTAREVQRTSSGNAPMWHAGAQHHNHLDC